MAKVFFITGKPGCGKSTLIMELVKKLKRVCGILTPEIRKGKRRIGFWIIDLKSGEKRILASTEIKHGPRVSKYKVSLQNIEEIVEKFYQGFKNSKYVIIDEIGKMELYSNDFKNMLKTVFSSNKIVIATLHRNLVNKYGKFGKVFHLKKENFEDVKKEIIKEICKASNL